MKQSTKNKKVPIQQQGTQAPKARISAKRWAIMFVAIIGTAGATWAFMEFVIWNTLPAPLVGQWQVVKGPPVYNEAVFEFFRNGNMVAHMNDSGKLRVINAQVRVEGDKIYSTSYHPVTGEEHVDVQTIRLLTHDEFIVADERGSEIRMARIP